jgi:plastocyanin
VASPGVGTSAASPDPGTDVSLPAFETEDCPSPPPQASPAPGESPLPGSSPAPGDSPAPGASPGATALTIETGEFWFSPQELSVAASGATTLILANSGISVHNFTVDELGIEIVASRGRSGQTNVVDPPPGTYLFYCSISGHKEAGMVGRLIVG